ncbi:uncharacterized protein LOC117120681 [Anneissia japonica]|uniref:uncharacterized protein LOC117120681 n=1 Tax=Anneissia japonica TaxID=1529436 RepID=UPI0014257976|nr:uncharacterized protein LOC117120681 [Anneissia japonica]
MELDMYIGLDENGLREKLTSCKDISERCRIRAAIRKMSNASIEAAASKAKISRERRNVEPLEDRVNKLMEEEAKEREKKLEKLEEKIKGITDEDDLRLMLKETDDYYERKRIRTAVRELRRAKDAEIEAYRPTRRASRQQQHDLVENGLNLANTVIKNHPTSHSDDQANIHIDESSTKNIVIDTDMIDACQLKNGVSKSEEQQEQNIGTDSEGGVTCKDSMIVSDEVVRKDSDKCIRVGVKAKEPPDQKVPANDMQGVKNLGYIEQQPINEIINGDPAGHKIEAEINWSAESLCRTLDNEISVQTTSEENQVAYDSNVLVPSGHTWKENMHLLPDRGDDTQVLNTLPIVGSVDTVLQVETEDNTENLIELAKPGKDKLCEMNKEREQKLFELNNEKNEISEDVFAIQDEDILRMKLRETDNIEKKRQIRGAMRELRKKNREKSLNDEDQVDQAIHATSSLPPEDIVATNHDSEVESPDQELTTIQIAFEVPDSGQFEDDEAVNSHDASNQDDMQTSKEPDIIENIDDITDINQLQRLLDDCGDLDERRRIRIAIRHLRRRLREEQEYIESKRDEEVAMVTPQDEVTADGEQILESEGELDEGKIEGCQTIQIEFEVPQDKAFGDDDKDEEEKQTAVYPKQFAAFEKAVEGMTTLLQKGLPSLTQSLITEDENHRDYSVEDGTEEDEKEEDVEGDDEEEENDNGDEEKLTVPTEEVTQLPIKDPKEQDSDMFDIEPSQLSVAYKDRILTDPDSIKKHDVDQVFIEPCKNMHAHLSKDDDIVRNVVEQPVDNDDCEVESSATTSVQIPVNTSKDKTFQDGPIDLSLVSLDFERIADNLESLPVYVDDQCSTAKEQGITSDIASGSFVTTSSDITKGAIDLPVGKEDSTKSLPKSELRCDSGINVPHKNRTSRNNSDQEDSCKASEVKAVTEPKKKMLSKKSLFLNDTKTLSESPSSSRTSSIAGSLASTPTSASPHSSRSGSISSPSNKVISMRNKFQFGALETTPHKVTSKRDEKIIKGMAGKVSGVAAKFSSEASTPKKSYSPAMLPIKRENKVPSFIQSKNQANSPSTLVFKNKNESSPTSTTGLVLSDTPKKGNVLERYQPIQSSIKKDTKQNITDTESFISKRKSQLTINLNSENLPKTPAQMVTIEPTLSVTRERPSYLQPIKDNSLMSECESCVRKESTTSILSISNSTDQNGNPVEISLELDITELQKRELTSKSEIVEVNTFDNSINKSDSNMAPDIEHMEDANELEKMLEVETVFEERKRIRARLRELRRLNKDVTVQPPTDRETRRRKRQEAINNSQSASTDDKNNNINEKTTAPKKIPPTIKSPSTPVDNKPPQSTITPSTPVDNKPPQSTKTPSTPVDNKPPLSPNNNSTALTNKTTETKTSKDNREQEKSVITDDGKTKTITNVKKTDKDGFQSVTKLTISKSVDGNKKSETETKEEIVRQDGPCGFSYSKKSTTVSSSSSSSSNVPESRLLTSKKMSKFDEELAQKKKEREEQRAADAIKWKEQQAARNERLKQQRIADQRAAKDKKANIMQMFGGKAQSGGGGSGGAPRMMVQNANSIKAKLLEWCKRTTSEYPNVKIENFSRSWNNGMAFCAIVHHYFPGAFNFDELNPKNRRHNFDLAFTTAESLANIMPLLDTDDMIMMKDTPDWKCVFTYVQSLYRNLQGKPVSPS